MQHEFCTFTESTTKLTTLPKNPDIRWRGNQLWWLDHTPRADRNSKVEMRTTKNYPISNPAINWRKIWIRIWLKNCNLIYDRMVFKIRPFKYMRKIFNERFIFIGYTVMRLIIQYFWEINNLFDSVGKGIAIVEIWKYTAH